MTLIMNPENFQQKNGTLLITKSMDNIEKEMKMIQPFSLK